MEVTAKVDGLEDAMKAMLAAFPSDPTKQRQILNSSMRKSAAATMLPEIKRRALTGSSGVKKSGALSESIGIRALSKRNIRTRRVVAGLEITPIRSNLKAMALYINYYYTQKGKTPPAGIILSGIRHGHLVEFGSVNNDAQSFLWEPARGKLAPYMQRLAADMRRTIEGRVKRARKHSVTGRAGR